MQSMRKSISTYKEYFPINKSYKSGLTTMCRSCQVSTIEKNTQNEERNKARKQNYNKIPKADKRKRRKRRGCIQETNNQAARQRNRR